MDSSGNYLVSLLYEGGIVKVAVKTQEYVDYYMEDEGKAKILSALPVHIQSMEAPIVDVEEIDDVVVQK